MLVLVVNPNSTASMTEKIGAAARAAVRADTEVLAVNPPDGPPAIQGFLDAALCVPHLLGEVARHPQADAVVIACFDDTGLDAVRAAVDVPVVGIGEAAFHAASFLCCRFSVVTTLGRSVPGIEANLARYGLDRRCAGVRATEIPVLDLERGDPETCRRVSAEVGRAIDEDGAEAVVLGCAGMTDLMARLAAEHGIPVVDGVAAGALFAEALAVAGLRTSKIGGYARPPG